MDIHPTDQWTSIRPIIFVDPQKDVPSEGEPSLCEGSSSRQSGRLSCEKRRECLYLALAVLRTHRYPRIKCSMDENQSDLGPVDTALEFGRFRVLPRRREVLTDEVTVALGARAFDLLMALIEVNGSLVPKSGP